MPGRISAANRAATDQPSGSPSSAASSSHSASVTGALYCGCSSRSFSARNRANSSRCHCSYAHSATSSSRSPPSWRHFARSPLRSAAWLGVEVLGPAVGEHPERLDRSTRRALRRPAGGEHRRLELLAEG